MKTSKPQNGIVEINVSQEQVKEHTFWAQQAVDCFYEGERQERERIEAYLRGWAQQFGHDGPLPSILRQAADNIERGDHVRK